MELPLLKCPIYDLDQLRHFCRLIVDSTGSWELLLPFARVWVHLEVSDPKIRIQLPLPWNEDWGKHEITLFVQRCIKVIEKRSSRWWQCSRHRRTLLALEELRSIETSLSRF